MNKYDEHYFAALPTPGAETINLTASAVKAMANGDGWRREAARDLRRDLEHNNSGWCSVDVEKASYNNGPAFVVIDVEI